jgi:uncharacterized cupredoxin-like copper-binding protein
VKKSVCFVVTLVAMLSVALAACGGTPQPVPTAETMSEEGGTGDGGITGPPAATVQLGVQDDKLAFDTNTLEVTIAEGDVLAVQLNNASQTRNHSFVLLNTADMEEADAYVEAAAAAGADNLFVPTDPSMQELALGEQVYTVPGETGEALLLAPAPGDYLFVSTVPGSFAAGMHGTLTVKAP